jgi:hypothetical protein
MEVNDSKHLKTEHDRIFFQSYRPAFLPELPELDATLFTMLIPVT